MKTLQWLKLFENQFTRHGKFQYTVTELAHLADCSRPVLNVALSRLVKQGVLARYAHGVYGLPNRADPEALLPLLDSHAYITGDFALSSYSLVTQPVHRITCFTNRRHNRSRIRKTLYDTYKFVTVSPSIYMPPRKSAMAGPEQALLDFIYHIRREGISPDSVFTFRNLHALNQPLLEQLMGNYPRTVQQEAKKLTSQTGK